jgi:phosphonate C-P lyase system protein PhnG
MTLIKEETQKTVVSDKDGIAALKEKLQKVICDTTEEMLDPLLDIMAELDLDIAMTPSPGLLMMNIRDSSGTVFHLGEVLVTRAEVKQNGQTGFGCSRGDRPNAALALACLDVLCRCEIPHLLKNSITKEINYIDRLVSIQRNTKSQITAATKVNFHSMAKE